ncbi:ATP-binding cassette domain-containing protein [Emticicia sp. BO119]|uniref:ATP-binding cassette domain-containing protein n=1 Tax=Emticicia sp. BO119 TaxID=2757768 RepID=UPI0015F00C7A|nr:ATP-binding cassette domain-containing protein [Emticicia sp. BO119]MBA4850462.1 ATP-binding cassette domain-containing protein [Emticicia sp. BO119]
MTKHILEADSIYLEFGTHTVLSDIYVRADTGKVTGFLGRNGSGKSSLMRIIFGSLKGNFQSVRFNKNYQECLLKVPDTIRYLPQKTFIPKQLSIAQICNLFQVSFNDIVNEFPIFEKYQHQKLGALSGGEIRLFETITILISKVKFVLLDEPFSYIMPLHIDQLKKIINKEKHNKGIIITDHLYKHIMEITDELYLIRDGKSFTISTNDDLLKHGYILE